MSYKEVGRGDTGHAESIEIQFDSQVLSYEDLLLHFFKMHNPTTLNQQGNDKGTQYRSAIFFTNEQQSEAAHKIIGIVDRSNVWGDSVKNRG